MTDTEAKMITDLVENARADGKDIVISTVPHGEPLQLRCQACGAILARGVQGTGTASHRCTNRNCAQFGGQVRHLFVTR